MSKLNLSQEEQGILSDFESGEFKSILSSSRKIEIQKIAENTFKKDKRINIRLSSHDLLAIQRRATEEGIPYQTLVSSVLHKFVSGTLLDVTANKHIKPNSLY
ncbi:MAG: hypothetical protein JKY81_12260 [Colwellia sp.]|nr:hypothetical protein [Colwellia sp.]